MKLKTSRSIAIGYTFIDPDKPADHASAWLAPEWDIFQINAFGQLIRITRDSLTYRHDDKLLTVP
jgi:hypothetical protein